MVSLPTRRFGRTELSIPLLSLGGMRFQQSWTDLPADQIQPESQDNLETTLQRAIQKGFHHIETARHYGSSERQIGWALPRCPDPARILQSKVPPRDDPEAFEEELSLSCERLGSERLDLLAIHGINLPEHLEQTLRPGGCMDVVRRWQAEGRIGHVGFSTHGPTELIVASCDSGAFDYVNLHWYYIRQDNSPALDAAQRQDMGVFIISPTDKGGHLHTPSQRLLDLCDPLHPIVFNDLFCLSDPRVHTISVGAARPEDLDLPVLLWLHNLLEAWDLESYARARYRLLGSGGHWFAGANADPLGDTVQEEELLAALAGSPWQKRIITILHTLKGRLAGESGMRLSSV